MLKQLTAVKDCAIIMVQINAKERKVMIYYYYLKDALKAQQKNGGTILYDSENKAYYII